MIYTLFPEKPLDFFIICNLFNYFIIANVNSLFPEKPLDFSIISNVFNYFIIANYIAAHVNCFSIYQNFSTYMSKKKKKRVITNLLV